MDGDWAMKYFTDIEIESLSLLQGKQDDEQGFYRMDLKWRDTLHGGTFWIKPGLDLFTNL